jgi:hypothetical protein
MPEPRRVNVTGGLFRPAHPEEDLRVEAHRNPRGHPQAFIAGLSARAARLDYPAGRPGAGRADTARVLG